MSQQEDMNDRCIDDLEAQADVPRCTDDTVAVLQQAGSIDYEMLTASHRQFLAEESGESDGDNPFFFETLLIGDSELCCLQISPSRKHKGSYVMGVVGFASVPRSILNYII